MLRMMGKKIVMNPIGEKPWGDLMTMEEFIDHVNSGCLINYDGYGNLATADEFSNIEIWPSHIKRGQLIHGFTHVLWYNR